MSKRKTHTYIISLVMRYIYDPPAIRSERFGKIP